MSDAKAYLLITLEGPFDYTTIRGLFKTRALAKKEGDRLVNSSYSNTTGYQVIQMKIKDDNETKGDIR